MQLQTDYHSSILQSHLAFDIVQKGDLYRAIAQDFKRNLSWYQRYVGFITLYMHLYLADRLWTIVFLMHLSLLSHLLIRLIDDCWWVDCSNDGLPLAPLDGN